ncbi:DUF3558 domain-containing protein [Saccharopolyspora erythraea]|uniref:DUF3558 domain-containing protein n=1 Tax=Saccharopolyspora erythraea TaxID=1836 RepID=UPI001BA72BE2|nr:DUF3558 domain-containing protein [Saccharopolyspora erythraea]QUH00451.1 DUF3558 domain-containing protein [Saccharopolyspora erythraea]
MKVLKNGCIVLSVLLVAGCGGWVAGGSESQSGPRIGVPLEITMPRASACDLLTGDQLPALGLQDPRPTFAAGGCAVRSGDGERSLEIDMTEDGDHVSPKPLGELYASHKTMPYLYFDPVRVRGYPAVLNSRIQQRSPFACTVTVGTATDSSFEIDYWTAGAGEATSPDACAMVQRAAETVIDNVKAGKV